MSKTTTTNPTYTPTPRQQQISPTKPIPPPTTYTDNRTTKQHTWASPMFVDQVQKRLQYLEDENIEMIRLFTELKKHLLKKYFTVKEASAYLGMHVSTISEKCRTGQLKTCRVKGGKIYYIHIDALNQLINRN